MLLVSRSEGGGRGGGGSTVCWELRIAVLLLQGARNGFDLLLANLGERLGL